MKEESKIRVVVDTNGTISDLKEGIDYTVVATGGNGGWYQYDYTIDKSLFSGDGRYIITLYSKDAAGNMNANIDESIEVTTLSNKHIIDDYGIDYVEFANKDDIITDVQILNEKEFPK